MKTENIAERILWNPLKKSADKLIIISNYATPATLGWFIEQLIEHKVHKIAIELFLSMTATEGIKPATHTAFIKMIKDSKKDYIKKVITSLHCSYLYNTTFNDVIYIWEKNGRPIQAFQGNASFTLSTFLDKNHQCLMTTFSLEEAYKIYQDCIDNSIYCNHSEIEEHIKILKSHYSFDNEHNCLTNNQNKYIEKRTFSLLKSGKSEIGARSSLNWGQRNNRDHNQAYIPIHAKCNAKDFFPSHEYFFALTDDKHSLLKFNVLWLCFAHFQRSIAFVNRLAAVLLTII
mgnify:CR=1 FL=1